LEFSLVSPLVSGELPRRRHLHVNQNERAVKTNFGAPTGLGPRRPAIAPSRKASMRREAALQLSAGAGHHARWALFQVALQRVYKVSISTQTVNMAFDPEFPGANQSGTVVEAVTKIN